MTVPLRVLYCHCAFTSVVPKAVKEEVLRRLTDSGLPFDAVPDLCELTAKKDPCLKDLAAGGDAVRIAACYPRAVRWMFAGAGAPLPENGVEVLNMRTETAETVLAGLFAPATTVPEAAS